MKYITTSFKKIGTLYKIGITLEIWYGPYRQKRKNFGIPKHLTVSNRSIIVLEFSVVK